MPNFSMADQFRGLPMGDLIGGPLTAACDAQIRLANATADFIKVIGFLPPAAPAQGGVVDPNAVGDVRNVTFKFDRPSQSKLPDPANPDAPLPMETVELSVPLLAVVKVPNLSINKVDITFDMEVKNSEASKESTDMQAAMEATAKIGWGPISATVKISGSVSSHKENTRSTDQSAKYHVEVHASDDGMPEGLARVLDMIATSVAPKQITQH
ncbi:DUF2589 domain-containing protein [Ferrovibrio xuzhouensis]|uniref:DUF2589 domain-containing protein n=1 Tax=Ferrovibrio xuzhouensis TaxID=1576914 RepID=A0ABV7VF68_9PROT